MTTAQVNSALHGHEVAAWADFENTVAEIVRDECKPSVAYERAFPRVVTAVRRKMADALPTRDQCFYIAEQVNLAYGFDVNGERIPPTPDDVRDQEAQADLLWAREMDANDSSRIRAEGI